MGQCVQSLEITRKYNHRVNGQTVSSIIQVNMPYQEKTPGFALTSQCRDSTLVSTHLGLSWFYLGLTDVQGAVLA